MKTRSGAGRIFMLTILELCFCVASGTAFGQFIHYSEEKDEAMQSFRVDLSTSGKTVQFVSEGIRIRPPSSSTLQPLQTPNMTLRKNETTGVAMPLFRHEDLWRFDQRVAHLRAPAYEIFVDKLAMPSPDPLLRLHSGQFVLCSEYEKWRSNLPLPEDREIKLSDWTRLMYGFTVPQTPAETRQIGPMKIELYAVEAEQAPDLAFFVLTDTKQPTRRYSMLFYLKNAVGHMPKIKALTDAFFFMVPVKETPNKNADHNDDPIKVMTYLLSQAVRFLPSWSIVTYKNAIAVTDAAKQKREIRVFLEYAVRQWELFCQLFRFPDTKKPLVYRFFDDKAAYMNFAGRGSDQHKQMWLGRINELVSGPLSWYSSPTKGGKKMDDFYDQFNNNLYNQFFALNNLWRSDPWFREGTREMFRNMVPKSAKVMFDVSPENMSRAFNDTGLRGARHMAGMDYKAYWDQEIGREQRAWNAMNTLAYYLYKGAPYAKKWEYAVIPYKYARALSQTGDAKFANSIAWKGVDMEKLDADLAEFYRSKNGVTSVKSYDLVSNLNKIYEAIPDFFSLPKPPEKPPRPPRNRQPKQPQQPPPAPPVPVPPPAAPAPPPPAVPAAPAS